MCTSRHVVLGALLVALAGCDHFAHTNPLDVETPVAVEVTGQDSAFSYFDTVTFVAHTLPSYAPERIRWTRTGGLELIPIGTSTFYVSESQYRQTAAETVSVDVDGRIASHVLHFVHRATSIRARSCYSVSPTILDSFGAGTTLCVSIFDARGHPVPVPTPVVTVSDPSVLTFYVQGAEAQVTAVGNGTSFVRFFTAGMSDSVAITVRQRLRWVKLNPAGCDSPGISLAVGDSIQLSPTNQGLDPGHNLIADTARVRAAVANMYFDDGDFSKNSVTVSSSGLVIATQPGSDAVQGVAITPAEGSVLGVCTFTVR